MTNQFFFPGYASTVGEAIGWKKSSSIDPQMGNISKYVHSFGQLKQHTAKMLMKITNLRGCWPDSRSSSINSSIFDLDLWPRHVINANASDVCERLQRGRIKYIQNLINNYINQCICLVAWDWDRLGQTERAIIIMISHPDPYIMEIPTSLFF